MFSIRAPEDAPDIVSAIKYLLYNRIHTDFYLVSPDGSEKRPVHKLILAMNSPVLAKLLYAQQPVDFLQVKYGDKTSLINLINFFYDEELLFENISDIRKIKTIAEKYEISKLIEICKEELNNVPVSMEDVLSNLEIAREFKNEEKENECLKFISENQEEIFTSREFLGWPFRTVLDIFEKYKSIGMMSDATILRLSIRWIETNGNKDLANKKELLMRRIDVTSISLKDYANIVIEFPAFFNGIEISYALKEIMSRCEDTEESKKELINNVNFFKNELNTAMETNKSLEEKDQLLVVETQTIKLELEGKNRKVKELEQIVKKLREKTETMSPMSSLSYSSLETKQKHLSIQILNEEDGVNVYEFEKRARITIQDGSVIRSIQIALDDSLKKSLIGTVAEKKGSHSESNVDISYEGIYFMLRSLKELDETLSPIQFIEVLKAALHFQIKDVAEKCIKRLSGITDYDPLFLDGLKHLSCLKDKASSLGLKGLSEFNDRYKQLLLSEPLRVILHPNFTKCDVNLIIFLLQQNELKVKDESQLLLVIIAWLEAQKEDRRLFRTTLLKNLAFESISATDFRYAIMHYPNFFDEKEQKHVLAFRNAVGSEVKFYRDNLPEWYSVKTRRHI